MDSQSDTIAFRNWLLSLEEDYLTGISNKGIYNRALKDTADTAPVIAFQDGCLTSVFSDGQTCSVGYRLKPYKCSCPSRSLCKHVIMTLIMGMRETQTLFGSLPDDADSIPSGEGLSRNYTHLLELTQDQLRKLTGEKDYQSMLFRLRFDIQASFSEGAFLTVYFPQEDVTVKFPYDSPVSAAQCSCKSAGFCRHCGEAVLYYQISKGIIDPRDLDPSKILEIATDLFSRIEDFLRDLSMTGLSRMSPASRESMEQLAVLCHRDGLSKLEAQFRRLACTTGLYFSKDAGFSKKSFLETMAGIYMQTQAIRHHLAKGTLQAELTGEMRSIYHDIPALDLIGMGAENWHSKSGYMGMTLYFYQPRLNQILSYSQSRPTYHEGVKNDIQWMRKAALPWGLEGNMETLAVSKVRLFNGKMNESGRLSSSSESVAKYLGDTDFFTEEIGRIALSDYERLLDKAERQSIPYNLFLTDHESPALIDVHGWGVGSFDELKQQFRREIHDAEGHALIIKVDYSEYTQHLIHHLERFSASLPGPERLLGRFWIEDDELCYYPISGYYRDGRAIHLTLV